MCLLSVCPSACQSIFLSISCSAARRPVQMEIRSQQTMLCHDSSVQDFLHRMSKLSKRHSCEKRPSKIEFHNDQNKARIRDFLKKMKCQHRNCCLYFKSFWTLWDFGAPVSEIWNAARLQQKLGGHTKSIKSLHLPCEIMIKTYQNPQIQRLQLQLLIIPKIVPWPPLQIHNAHMWF